MEIKVRKENKDHIENIRPINKNQGGKLKIIKDKNEDSRDDSDSDLISSVDDASEYSSEEENTKFKKARDKSYAELSNPVKIKQPGEYNSDNEDGDSVEGSDDNNSVISSTKSEAISETSNNSEQSIQSRHRKRRKVRYESEEERKKINDEKADILAKLDRLKQKGLKPQIKLSMRSDIDDLRKEYKRLVRTIEVDNSIKFQRRSLVAILSGLEFLNKKFDPFDVKLDGWSESVMDNLDDYDNIFEKLYDKYSGTAEVAPEIELIMMIAGSAFMFHMTKTLFSNNVPNMSDIIKENPSLMQSIANSMKNNSKSQQLPPQAQQFPQSTINPNVQNTTPNRINEDLERMSEASFVTDMSDVKNVTVTTTQNSKKQPKKVMNLEMI